MKVATIIGEAVMCSDDGRAISHSWRIQTNNNSGRGYYTDAKRLYNVPESYARNWCKDNGYEVTKVAWT